MSGILLLGGGGHCRSVLDVIRSTEVFERVGIVEADDAVPAQDLEELVVGGDSELPRLLESFRSALVTLGHIKSAGPRERLFNLAADCGAHLPIVKSPRAYTSPTAELGRGTVVMHGAIVSSGVVVAENCIVNSMALVEHDAQVGAHTHVSTGARINGEVRIGSRTFIGSGAIVRESVTIGDDCVVGAGCVVLNDVANGVVLKARNV